MRLCMGLASWLYFFSFRPLFSGFSGWLSFLDCSNIVDSQAMYDWFVRVTGLEKYEG